VPPPLNLRSKGMFAEEAASLWTSSSGLLFCLIRVYGSKGGVEVVRTRRWEREVRVEKKVSLSLET
jgi:hypothetical protein